MRGGRERVNKSKRELESGMERLGDRVDRERGRERREGRERSRKRRRDIESEMEIDRERGRMR
jgi:hypothetical protein